MGNDHTTPLPVASTAGAQLRAAREAAGWSQEAVAQQLKLAPRQVRAIEEDDYARLPGRTFVRGFVRNYARLVRLDPTAVSRPMVELPVASVRRNSWARWLIPLALLAIVAAAGVYEFMRNAGGSRRLAENAAVTSPPVPASPSTALPNPLASAKTESAAPMEKSAAAAVAPSNTTAPTAESVAPATTVATPGAAASDAPLLLTFKEKSWVEVKDGNGAAIFMQTGAAGTTQTLSATPPLDVSIGNAAGVTVTYRGQSIDIAPYTRK